MMYGLLSIALLMAPPAAPDVDGEGPSNSARQDTSDWGAAESIGAPVAGLVGALAVSGGIYGLYEADGAGSVGAVFGGMATFAGAFLGSSLYLQMLDRKPYWGRAVGGAGAGFGAGVILFMAWRPHEDDMLSPWGYFAFFGATSAIGAAYGAYLGHVRYEGPRGEISLAPTLNGLSLQGTF